MAKRNDSKNWVDTGIAIAEQPAKQPKFEATLPTPPAPDAELAQKLAEVPASTISQLPHLKAQRKELQRQIDAIEKFLRTSAPAKGDSIVSLHPKTEGKTGFVVWVGRNSLKAELIGVRYLVTLSFADCRKLS